MAEADSDGGGSSSALALGSDSSSGGASAMNGKGWRELTRACCRVGHKLFCWHSQDEQQQFSAYGLFNATAFLALAHLSVGRLLWNVTAAAVVPAQRLRMDWLMYGVALSIDVGIAGAYEYTSSTSLDLDLGCNSSSRSASMT
eukprot:scaffold98663_cov21-Tisochrysis_lutea.AAC.2